MLSSTFIANANFSVLWNGQAFIIIRIVYVPKKEENTCNMPLYIMHYCTAKTKRRKNNLNNRKTKATQLKTFT